MLDRGPYHAMARAGENSAEGADERCEVVGVGALEVERGARDRVDKAEHGSVEGEARHGAGTYLPGGRPR